MNADIKLVVGDMLARAEAIKANGTLKDALHKLAEDNLFLCQCVLNCANEIETLQDKLQQKREDTPNAEQATRTVG